MKLPDDRTHSAWACRPGRAAAEKSRHYVKLQGDLPRTSGLPSRQLNLGVAGTAAQREAAGIAYSNSVELHMDNSYHFKRAVQIASHDFDAIQRLCQVKVNEVGEVRRLRAIGDVSMRAQGYINACHDFLGLPEDRVRQLVWSLNEYRMTRREQLVGAYFRDEAPDVTYEVEVEIDWWNGMDQAEQEHWLSQAESTRPRDARRAYMAHQKRECERMGFPS